MILCSFLFLLFDFWASTSSTAFGAQLEGMYNFRCFLIIKQVDSYPWGSLEIIFLCWDMGVIGGFAIDWFRTKRTMKSCICPLIVVLASKTMSLCKFLMAKVWGHELLYEGITFKLPNFLQFSKRKQRVTSLAGTMYFSYCSVWAAFLFISSFCEISEPVIPPCLWANETVSENSTLQWVHG